MIPDINIGPPHAHSHMHACTHANICIHSNEKLKMKIFSGSQCISDFAKKREFLKGPVHMYVTVCVSWCTGPVHMCVTVCVSGCTGASYRCHFLEALSTLYFQF